MKPFILFVSLLSSLSFANEDAFRSLKCEAVISDKLTISTKKNVLNYNWSLRGGHRVLPLLQAFAPKEIPASLLSAYEFLNVQFSLPLESCTFDSKQIGKFQCDEKAEVKVKIKAEIGGAYEGDDDATVDNYSGKVSSLKLASKFSVKHKFDKISFHLDAKVEGKTAKMATVGFFAEPTNSEGFSQDPDCMVDNEFIVVD